MTDHGRIARFPVATLAIAVTAAFFLSACSELGFPAVHDMPAPRAETTMTPDQVKQATDDLVSERDHLNTGSVPSAQAAAPNKPAPPKKVRLKPQPAAAQSVAVQPNATQPPAGQPATPNASATAGAYAKP